MVKTHWSSKDLFDSKLTFSYFINKVYVVGTSNEYPQNNISSRNKKNIYSRTSMARTFLGPWKFIQDMGSSSH